MTTDISRELARKRPAQITTSRPARRVIKGETVTRPLHLWRLAGWFAFAIGVVLFAGLLLSMLQQAA